MKTMARQQQRIALARLGKMFALLFFLIGSSQLFAAPPTQPAAVPPIDPALLKRLTEIDARASKITTLTGDFEQKKFTAKTYFVSRSSPTDMSM